MELLKSSIKDMENNKKKFEQEAKAFFADQKNDNVNTLYVTSDGCMFRAEHYANNWKNDLKDRTLETYYRNGSPLVNAIIDGLKAKSEADKLGSSASGATSSDQPSEREALVKEYIELFDTKPHHMLGIDKLKQAIDDKKAELALSEGSDLEGSEGTHEQSENTDQNQEPSADQSQVDNTDQTDNK